MKKNTDRWSHGRRYLLKWDGEGTVTTSAGAQQSRSTGEAVLILSGEHESVRGINLERFGLAASGVKGAKADTGVISVIGKSSTGAVKLSRKDDSLRVEAACEINYESLDRAHGKEMEKGCYYIPATEPCVALIEARSASARQGLSLDAARLYISCMAGEFGEVISIELNLKKTSLIQLGETPVHYRFDKKGNWAPSNDSNNDSNICIASTRRQLIIQPVGFRTSAADPSPSGSTSAAQFATAQTVWNKSCIDLVIRPTTLIDNATLKTSSNVAAIRASFTDPDPNVIEVFFVQNGLAAQGGGTAGGIGLASCKPVIAEPNGGNPVLVAHELGHVLALLHPPSANSDPGTVMAPTGSPMVPGTEFVTHIMCTSIANPVLQTTMTACCFSHDIPNHYLRDFPTDVGNEPSEPIGAGMNRYAMSNIWNRRTNTPGTPSPATGPEHQNPARFNPDMSVKTNYLYARVEQLVNFPVRGAEVKFYLKTPGSGGGAANLTSLGSVPVSAGLAVGSPQNVVLPWTIPAGTPNHSCVFGVVRSDAEPEGDQSSLDWWQFETLNYNDNDWAQRNLDIENVSSDNDSNLVESAPFFIELPPLKMRLDNVLTLDIDAIKAKGLKGLYLEITGTDRLAIQAGVKQKLKIEIAKKRKRLVGVFYAEIPPRKKKGTTFTVGANPSIGGRSFIGWGTQFAVEGPRDVIAQVLDSAAAGFGDLSEFAELPGVRRLFCMIAGSVCKRAYSSEDLALQLLENVKDLENAASQLRKIDAARETGADEAIGRLLRTVVAYKSGKARAGEVLEAFRAAANRAMMTAALLSRG